MREAAAAVFLILAACEAEVATAPEKVAAPQTAVAPAAGKAQQGQFSIKAPGFDMKIDIPKQVAAEAGAEANGELLYPGSRLSGMHVEAPSGASGPSGVELRFTSGDPPDKVAAWYRDPARAAHFAIAQASKQGEGLLLSGTRKEDGGAFSLRILPAPGGGSDGRLTLTERS